LSTVCLWFSVSACHLAPCACGSACLPAIWHRVLVVQRVCLPLGTVCLWFSVSACQWAPCACGSACLPAIGHRVLVVQRVCLPLGTRCGSACGRRNVFSISCVANCQAV
jgi:hypothetical protein